MLAKPGSSIGPWVTKAPMPQPRGLHGTGVVAGMLYAVGGAHASCFTPSATRRQSRHRTPPPMPGPKRPQPALEKPRHRGSRRLCVRVGGDDGSNQGGDDEWLLIRRHTDLLQNPDERTARGG